MSKYRGLFIQIVSNLILAIGCVSGYWSFSTALTLYLFEVSLFVLLGSIYFLFSKDKVLPGPILMGGTLLILICFYLTHYISDELGEYQDFDWTLEGGYFAFIKSILLDAWYFLPIIVVGTFISLFKENRNERAGTYGQLMLHRFVTMLAIFALSTLLIAYLDIKFKLLILMVVIASRIGVEFWIYGPGLRKKK